MAPKDKARALPSSTPDGRSVQISKALSWLLRHGAAKERVAIDASGYVNLADVLNWHKLRALKASFDEVIACVQSNEKQRFGLRWNAADPDSDPTDPADLRLAEAKGETPHQLALAHIEASTSPDARDYSIRAVQGHSMKAIDATALLTPITAEKAPGVCVHGTFFASWPLILNSGGLKAMTRNHVHFASGPAAADVLPDEATRATAGRDRLLKQAMERSEVVSGMRGDAQVLIYVDLKRSMEEGQMEWWKSDNGVILTEGVLVGGSTAPSELEETAMMLEETSATNAKPVNGGNGQKRRSLLAPASKTQRLVPMEYWDVVVGIGVGVLWQRGRGVVQEVPADMMQRGKGKHVRKGSVNKPSLQGIGKASTKPSMRVERDEINEFD